MMQRLRASPALLVDLYELTMAAGYFEQRKECRASFELFVRHLPPNRAYLVAAGIEAALDYLEELQFSEEEIKYLRSLREFKRVRDSFFDALRSLRFTGDVMGVPEGSLVFAEEPILQVSAPVIEAQIVETYLLSVINFETLVASKAARVIHAAAGREVLEFGTRRAQGPEAGLRAARAAYIGGCDATSNVKAGALYGIPVAGTAAHSWTQVFATERESFEALLRAFPDTAILLVDTYNALEGIRTAASLGRRVPGIRLDSGDILELSRQARRILDEHGQAEAKIIASGDLDEYRVDDLIRAGAPVDAFGVGTALATSSDAPALSVVYKLVETEENGEIEYKSKFSEEKIYAPGRKQVFRFSADGKYQRDVIARSTEQAAGAEPLLIPLMRAGKRVSRARSAQQIRADTHSNIERLPERYKALRNTPQYPVGTTEALDRLLEEVRQQFAGTAESKARPAK